MVFLLWNGGVFSLLMQNFATEPEISGSRGPLQMLFGGSILYFLPILLFCPALTMRSFAEERRTGTFETLMTAPVRDVEVVFGKYLALLVVFASLWAPTLLYALVIKRYGPVDWGALAAAYTGTMLIGAAFLSLGMLMSALARSQVTAFILGFAATGGLMFLLGLGKYVFTEEREQVVLLVHQPVGAHGALLRGRRRLAPRDLLRERRSPSGCSSRFAPSKRAGGPEPWPTRRANVRLGR